MVMVNLILFGFLVGGLIFFVLLAVILVMLGSVRRKRHHAQLEAFMELTSSTRDAREEMLLEALQGLGNDNLAQASKLCKEVVFKEVSIYLNLMDILSTGQYKRLPEIKDQMEALTQPLTVFISDQVGASLREATANNNKMDSEMAKRDEAIEKIFNQYLMLTRTEINPRKTYTISRKLTMMERIPFTSILSDEEVAEAEVWLKNTLNPEEETEAGEQTEPDSGAADPAAKDDEAVESASPPEKE